MIIIIIRFVETISVDRVQNPTKMSDVQQLVMKSCYFCGLEMEKHLLGMHNKEFHSVLRFDWVNGQPSILQAVESFVVQMPPLPRSPPPPVPRPPSQLPPIPATKSNQQNDSNSAASIQSLGPIDYDMDISAGSESDEGDLFQSKKAATLQPNERSKDSLKKFTNDDLPTLSVELAKSADHPTKHVEGHVCKYITLTEGETLT